MKFKSDIEVQAGLKDSSGSNGSSGQVLSSNGTTVSWVPAGASVASDVQNEVKAGVAINKGQAVYVTSADGTNIIVGLASNTSEATSSKTLGLLDATVAINDFANVVQIGRLEGLDTSMAIVGDPVWLGANGNLIYGLANKPYAPLHLVFIGVVTRVNVNNGEIFINVQNGFELNEIHDVDIKTTVPINGDVLGYDGTLWVNKTIAGWLGYTPVTNARTITINGVTQDLSANRSWTTTNGTVTSVAALTLGTTGTDLSSTVANPTTTPVITLNVPTASAANRGALSSADWSTFNNKQSALSGTGIVKSTAGVISYLTDNTANWNTAYNDKINSAAVTGTTTKTLTLNQQDGGTITASWTDLNSGGTVTSIATSGAILGGTITTTGTISHSTADGFLHVPATSTTNNGKVLTAGATAGSLSWTTPTVGTVTSVSGTGSYGGLTLSGTVTTSGNLTLGGTPTGTWPIAVSGNAATATTLQTARTINGVSFNGSADISISRINDAGGGGNYLSYSSGNELETFNSSGVLIDMYLNYSGGVNSLLGPAGNIILNAGNYNNYAPTKTGTGASGSWGIAITGNAGTATTLQTARTINGVSFNGSANITVADSTKLPLAGGTMTGAITFAAGQTWPTFNQSTTGNAATATALQTARTIGGVSFNGTANINLPGVNTAGNQNTSGTAAVSTAATATISATASAFKIPFLNTTGIVTGNFGLLHDSTATFTYNPSTNAMVVGTVTASGGFFNSDIRLKDLTNYDYNISDVKPITYFWKDKRDDKKHIGYSAQDVKKVMPDAINEDENGMLSVNYVEVLVAKIEMLEQRIKKLEYGLE